MVKFICIRSIIYVYVGVRMRVYINLCLALIPSHYGLTYE